MQELKKKYELIVDIRKINDSGIGTYLTNVIPATIGGISKCKIAVIANSLEQCRELPNKVDRIIFKSKSLTLLEQFEFLLKLPKTKFLWTQGLSYPFFSRAYLISTIHDFSHWGAYQKYSLKMFLKKIIVIFLITVCIKKSILILTNSFATKEEILKRYLKKIYDLKKKVVVTQLGVSSDWFSFIKTNSSNHNREYILCVANLKPHKNIKTLIKVFVEKKLYKIYDLILIGDYRKLYTKDQNVWDVIQSNKNIFFFSNVDQNTIMNYFSHASILVCPSYYEGFGLTVLEGMSVGIPVIASDISPHKEIGKNHIEYFKPSSPDELYKSINIVIKKNFNQKNKSCFAKNRAREMTWNKCVKETTNAMNKLLKKKIY